MTILSRYLPQGITIFPRRKQRAQSGRRLLVRRRTRPGVDPLESRVVLSTYYVSTTGNDSAAGTSAAPFATLQNAVSHLAPGDILNVESGSYAGFIVGWDGPGESVYGTIAGTAGKPITIQADPAASPGSVIINSHNRYTAVGIDLEPGCNYVTLNGLTIQNDGSVTKAGILATGNNDSITNNTVTGVHGFGIIVDNANNALIQGNTVTGTLGTNTQGHGIYVSGSSDGVIVRGNVIHDNGYIGIHVNGDLSEGGIGLVTHALIEGNVIYNNGQNGINADGLANSVIRNNLIYGYHGYGICLYQIDAASGSSNNVIVNNTIVGTLSGSSAALNILNASTGNTVLNNILLGGDGNAYEIAADSISGFVSDYNVTSAQWRSSTGQDTHSVVATPAQLFVNPTGNDYHLSAASPAIDAGTATDAPATDLDGNLRPSGTGYDIGAYELQQAAGTIPTVTSWSPSTGATAALTTAVTATFSASVQPSTISFVLKDSNGNTVPAQPVAYNNTTHTATLQPILPLAASTTYTATVSATNTSGNPMAAPFSWSFNTASPAPAPTVTSESPSPNATGVSTAAAVTAVFSASVQPSTISFVLKDSNGNTVPAQPVAYNNTTHTATLQPISPLAASTTYTATVSATNTSGNPMAAPFSWSFNTASPAPAPTVTNETPAPGATGVAATASVTTTFSGAMDPTTINTTTFVLRDASNKIVPATVSYNTATATLQPNAALTAGTTYTATVSGAKDQSGQAMTAPFTWSFTTNPAAPSPPTTAGTYNLWSGSAKPIVASDPDTGSVELGVKFSSDVAGSITGIRFYKGAGNGGTHVAHLWSSTGNLLASATFTSETASGWQQVNFAKPVAISANTTYVASYFAPAGHYAGDNGYFSSGYSSGPLHVPANGGVYVYGSQGSFPSQTWNASNYWVDVAFSTTTPPTATPTTTTPTTTTPPTTTGETPTPNATGVATTALPTATFSTSVQDSSIRFTLTGPSGATVPATVSYADTTHTATLTPTGSLSPSTKYTATVSAAKDAAGNAMAAPFSWSFTTATSTTSPTISAVNESGITANGATITWTTNVASSSQVEYGTTTSYGSSTTLNPSLVTSHSISLSGLSPNTLYHYRVKSADAAGNLATSPDYTFTTTAAASSTTVDGLAIPTTYPRIWWTPSRLQQA
jgi:parallel beta-helix repeat protein